MKWGSKTSLFLVSVSVLITNIATYFEWHF